MLIIVRISVIDVFVPFLNESTLWFGSFRWAKRADSHIWYLVCFFPSLFAPRCRYIYHLGNKCICISSVIESAAECFQAKTLIMGDCLHTSADSLSKLVKWAHSHGTICTLIPSLKHLLTEGAHGNLTALWGCSAGHAYHWPLTSSCKTAHKDRLCYERSGRGISTDSLMQGASSMQSSSTPRFHSSATKTSKGDSNQTRDSYDFSNCSEPSEMDDNTEEHLFDIVCESSATDEEGDSEPRVTPRKRSAKGPSSDDSTDPGAKKIKQERAEDYYTVANAQAQATSGGAPSSSISQSPKPTSQIRPSSRSSAPHNPQLLEDGDLVGVSSSPLENSSSSLTKHMHMPISGSQSRTHMNSHMNPAHNQGTSSLSQPGRSDMVEVLPNGDFSLPFEDPSGVGHPEMDILAAQSLSAEPKGDAGKGITHSRPSKV